MTVRGNTAGRILLPVFLLFVLFLVARSTGYAARAQAQAAAQPAGPAPCPGQTMPTVQSPGAYTPKPVTAITINPRRVRFGSRACGRTGTATPADKS